MMKPHHSNIGWTDFSGGALNFVIGCTPISPGCKHCYAQAWAERYGRDFVARTYPEKLEYLETWQPVVPACGHYKRGPGSRPMAFAVDMGDLFHENVPESLINRAFNVMARREDIDWQVLTKRHERLASYLQPYSRPPHIWFGVSVENSAHLGRIDAFRWACSVSGTIFFASFEPLLGPLRLPQTRPPLEWVICGGESGPNRRRFEKNWASNLYARCQKWGIPFFYKQGSAAQPGQDDFLDGQRIQEWPR